MDELLALARRVEDEPALRARYQAALVEHEAESACAARLAELAEWDAADALAQDAVMAWVVRTTPGVTWTGAATFACGGQQHRVGTFRHEATGLTLHLLPGGEYLRGTRDALGELAYWQQTLPPQSAPSPRDEVRLRRALEDEVPAHRLRVRPFLLARAPFSEAEWRRAGVPRRFLHREVERPPELPFVDTEPSVVEEWVRRAGLRLPREAEWEWACRAGTCTRFFWGDAPDPARFHVPGRDVRPSTPEHANAFGLWDMVGNGYELCSDLTDGAPQYRSPEEQRALHGYAHRTGDATPAGDGQGRRLRGGWATDALGWECRSASRSSCGLGVLLPIVGRPALDVGLRGEALPPAEDGAALAAGERRLGGARVRVVAGDIALQPVDAVVNAANDRLVMEGGVAGALRAAGGREIEREATRSAPAALGAVVRTGGGRLLAEHVYHAVVTRYDHRGSTSIETVRAAVERVVEQARIDEVGRLAIPLLAAGGGGLSVTRALGTILEALEAGAPAGGPPLEVWIVVQDPEEAAAAREALREHRDRAAREAEEDRLAQDYLEALRRSRPS